MSTELTLIEIHNPLQLFSMPNGLDAVIDKIEAEVKSIDRDISTEKGRDNIRSLSYKLAKSKTQLDKIGKELTEEQRLQINAVNAERKRAWERMEILQEEVRAPLTAWEEKEKSRVSAHEEAVKNLILCREPVLQCKDEVLSELIKARLDSLPELMNRDWQEFSDRAIQEVAITRKDLEGRHAAAVKAEVDAAEISRLRAEEEERKRREHDERVAAAATKEAEEKAEREAQAERERVERERKEEAAKAQRAMDDAAAETAAANERTRKAQEKAEADRLQAERDKKAAEEKATEKERQRVADEKAREEKAQAERERNQAHKKKINNEALAAIELVLGATHEGSAAMEIVKAIAIGKVPHVSIKY